MSLAIADARTWIRDYARNAGDFTEYLPARLDRAFQYIGNEFVRRTGCTKQTNTITLTASTATISTTGSGFATFRPEYLTGDPQLWVTVSGAFTAEVEVVDRSEIYDLQLNQASTAAPESGVSKIAFLRNDAGTTGAVLYPTPDDAATYVLNFMWSPPFTAWTAGSAPSPDSFNIPDEYLIPLLTIYVPRVLQHNEPEHIYAADRDAEFIAYCRERSGDGGFGVTSIKRKSLSDLRRW